MLNAVFVNTGTVRSRSIINMCRVEFHWDQCCLLQEQTQSRKLATGAVGVKGLAQGLLSGGDWGRGWITWMWLRSHLLRRDWCSRQMTSEKWVWWNKWTIPGLTFGSGSGAGAGAGVVPSQDGLQVFVSRPPLRRACDRDGWFLQLS